MAATAKIGIKLLTIVIGIPVGIATRKLVERTWLAARPDNPERKPSDPRVRWGDAIGWAALSAAGMVAADLLTRRSAEAAYSVITGNEPPVAETAKDKKGRRTTAKVVKPPKVKGVCCTDL